MAENGIVLPGIGGDTEELSRVNSLRSIIREVQKMDQAKRTKIFERLKEVITTADIGDGALYEGEAQKTEDIWLIDCIHSYRTLRECSDSCHRAEVANTESEFDRLLAQVYLELVGGLDGVSVTPLFETNEGIANSPTSHQLRITGDALESEDLQQVMFGMSDGPRNDGYLTYINIGNSAWQIQRQAKQQRREITFYHGRSAFQPRGGYLPISALPLLFPNGNIDTTFLSQGDDNLRLFLTPEVAHRFCSTGLSPINNPSWQIDPAFDPNTELHGVLLRLAADASKPFLELTKESDGKNPTDLDLLLHFGTMIRHLYLKKSPRPDNRSAGRAAGPIDLVAPALNVWRDSRAIGCGQLALLNGYDFRTYGIGHALNKIQVHHSNELEVLQEAVGKKPKDGGSLFTKFLLKGAVKMGRSFDFDSFRTIAKAGPEYEEPINRIIDSSELDWGRGQRALAEIFQDERLFLSRKNSRHHNAFTLRYNLAASIADRPGILRKPPSPELKKEWKRIQTAIATCLSASG